MNNHENEVSLSKQHLAVDLFSGCGGLTLGLKQAGFRVIGAVENDRLAVETYQKNHPEVAIWHCDIKQVTARMLLKSLSLKKGQLDLLAGCPPCQGFSSMRKLNGKRRIVDKQNDLVFEFLRLVQGLLPKTIMMENVPGLATNHRLRKLNSTLRALGYVVNSDVKDAREFGVPQRRRRFILLAGLQKEIHFAAPARSRPTVRSAFAKLSKRREAHDELHNLPESRSRRVKDLIRLIPKNGGSRTDLGDMWQLNCHKKCDGFRDVYGRMKWDDVSPTITGGCCNPSKGRFLHPSKNRTITLREASLLQSFPPDYFFSIERGKFPAAQMIGNALPPEFIRRHAMQIYKSINEE
jgi:DNA (cytosine-5)-methyltransferase 1